jgi:hypothetical protein
MFSGWIDLVSQPAHEMSWCGTFALLVLSYKHTLYPCYSFLGGFCSMHVVGFADDGMSRREMGKKGIYRLIYEVQWV